MTLRTRLSLPSFWQHMRPNFDACIRSFRSCFHLSDAAWPRVTNSTSLRRDCTLIFHEQHDCILFPNTGMIISFPFPRLRDVFDRWMLLQMVAIFCMSFGLGMLFMQGNILWHQYKVGLLKFSSYAIMYSRIVPQYGYGYWANELVTMEEVMKARVLSKIAADPQVFQWSQGQLKVNTTLFVR